MAIGPLSQRTACSVHLYRRLSIALKRIKRHHAFILRRRLVYLDRFISLVLRRSKDHLLLGVWECLLVVFSFVRSLVTDPIGFLADAWRWNVRTHALVGLMSWIIGELRTVELYDPELLKDVFGLLGLGWENLILGKDVSGLFSWGRVVVIGEAEIHLLIVVFKGVLSLVQEAVIAQISNKFWSTKLWSRLSKWEFIPIIISIIVLIIDLVWSQWWK